MVSNTRVSSTSLPPIQHPQTPQNRIIIPNRSYHFLWYRARFASPPSIHCLSFPSSPIPHFQHTHNKGDFQNKIVSRVTVTVTVTCDVDRQKYISSDSAGLQANAATPIDRTPPPLPRTNRANHLPCSRSLPFCAETILEYIQGLKPHHHSHSFHSTRHVVCTLS
jgi:hypothetical protein